MIYFLFTLIGIYFLSIQPLTSILVFILSLQPLFRLMERRGQPFSHKAYLLLCFVLIGTGLFSFSQFGFVYMAIGTLHILFAITTWLSYQQMRIDQREDKEE